MLTIVPMAAQKRLTDGSLNLTIEHTEAIEKLD
jgi:hypothetical protein